jgi:GNAT superfamily N-acetyltransferase
MALAKWTLAGEQVLLRRAHVGDVAAIVELLADDPLGATGDGGQGADLGPYQRAFAAIDADPAHLLVVATSDDDTPIGTMQLSYLHTMGRRGALLAQIEGVRVASAHRRRGLGSAMFRWAINQARQHGCPLVQLTTNKRRTETLSFYDQLGFVASSEGLKLYL